MITDEIFYSLQSANRELLKAENELSRPHEDVVTLSACNAIRNSMKQIMRLYLFAHSANPGINASLSDLLSDCIGINKAFSTVNVTSIECKDDDHKNCDGRYCLSVENVAGCLSAAGQLKSLVWKELKI